MVQSNTQMRFQAFDVEFVIANSYHSEWFAWRAWDLAHTLKDKCDRINNAVHQAHQDVLKLLKNADGTPVPESDLPQLAREETATEHVCLVGYFKYEYSPLIFIREFKRYEIVRRFWRRRSETIYNFQVYYNKFQTVEDLGINTLEYTGDLLLKDQFWSVIDCSSWSVALSRAEELFWEFHAPLCAPSATIDATNDR